MGMECLFNSLNQTYIVVSISLIAQCYVFLRWQIVLCSSNSQPLIFTFIQHTQTGYFTELVLFKKNPNKSIQTNSLERLSYTAPPSSPGSSDSAEQAVQSHATNTPAALSASKEQWLKLDVWSIPVVTEAKNGESIKDFHFQDLLFSSVGRKENVSNNKKIFTWGYGNIF